MANRALTFGFGGYADLDVTFGEFLHQNHTVMLRFLPAHPYAGPGPMLAENGSGTYLVGQGDYRWGSGDFKNLGPSTLFVQLGSARVVYEVPGFTNEVGGPVGYRRTWQHLAVRRQGNTITSFLNGQPLAPFEGPDLIVPTSGLPAAATPMRIGRRTSGAGDSKLYWQFYGVIDDVAIYTTALSAAKIQQAAAIAPLTGAESGLLAGWTFDTPPLPPKLARPVVLPTARHIPDDVTPHADHPLPVYYVNVSVDRDSAEDSTKLDLRPSKVRATVPFGAGEWWQVVQGWEDPNVSHNGPHAFCWDFHRVNGNALGQPVFAAAAGRVIYVTPPDQSAISSYHAAHERVVYMHLPGMSFSKHFPDLASLPQHLPPGSQPAYAARQPIADAPGGNLHFATAAITGETATGDEFPEAGSSLPNALENYYLSKNGGKNWAKVSRGIPIAGDLVARYPWSPWGDTGEIIDVAPAAASRGPNRLDVFARGENGRLWHKRWNGQAWSGWAELGGGRLTSSPAAVSWGEDRLDIFVRGHDGQLAHRRWTSEHDWSDWRDLGGRLTSAPAVASWGPNRLDVFVRGHDGQLAHKRWTDDKDWSEWRDLGGRLTSAPAAVSWGQNRIDVFVRGHDGGLAHKRWTDDKDWSDWRDLGGRLTSAPAVASWGANRLDVFVRGHEGGLAHKRWTDDKDWSEWRDLGGRLTSGPAAVSWGLNRIDVFVRGFEHQLAHKRWSGDQGWSEWRNLDVD